MAMSRSADLVVVGAGVAGIAAALTARAAGLRVVLVHKGPRWQTDRTEQATATFYAQGGVAVVMPDNPADSVDSHLADTLAAGAGLSDPAASRPILDAGWAAVSELISWGTQFDRDPTGALARTREGGHRVRRILHAGGDATGAAVQRALWAALGEAQAAGGIECLDESVVTRVLTDIVGRAVGVSYSRSGANGGVGEPGVVSAPTVLLATGGAGHLYAATTNPSGATADGIALALRAGARVADLEFIQFHPTMLYTPGERGRRTLVTEAIRGEGGRLVDADGASVTAGVHPLGDLAPRDVVANAAMAALARTGHPCVYLDISGIDRFADRFPTVTAGVRAAGLSLDSGLIPVVPGAHYQCGGVVTDTFARTGVPGLLAAGEVARTGLHGANRLASNSLLEGVVMGIRAAGVAVTDRDAIRGAAVDGVHGDEVRGHEDLTALDRTTLQDAMSRHVALCRDASGLAEVATLLESAPMRRIAGVADAEDASLTLAAGVVVAAAAARRESRGCHVRSDFPRSDVDARSRYFGLARGVIAEVADAAPVSVPG
ncbi:L-aspartate oxidase [Gordonia polyisoprenivorans]|uniref:L-aspartate oxidase n=1 Tax=Gordonia polyisoprenivorans TaxID=84595 RepID=UPI000B99E7FF|nr:L-aspartate oxidase [Gordonia polyisoprenivorans]OZC33461.1 L-aspartate oxidase [Gordonia polyisoprenivorans]